MLTYFALEFVKMKSILGCVNPSAVMILAGIGDIIIVANIMHGLTNIAEAIFKKK